MSTTSNNNVTRVKLEVKDFNFCKKNWSLIELWVNMQFSGLNKIHSQLTAYTGQSVHAVS